MGRYRQPSNEDEFEHICLTLLQNHWASPQVDRFGHRGERQHGIDLIDKSGTTPLRVAQCKHHRAWKTLPPAELRAEVTKAKGFPRTIGLYLVLTSAKRSAETDLEVVDINEAHKKEGLFVVDLLTWDGIERLLDDYPEVAEKLGMISPPQWRLALETHTTKVSAGLQELRDTVVVRRRGDDFDDRLDEAKRLTDDGQPRAARMILERLRERLWPDLTPSQRQRLQARTAGTHLAQANYERAGMLLVEAGSVVPADDDAKAQVALGWELLGDTRKAHECAREVLDRSPANARAAAVFARTAESDADLDRLGPLVAGAAPVDAELELALAQRAFEAKDLPVAVDRSRRAVSLSPEWGAAWLLLGTSLLAQEIERVSSPGAKPPGTQDAVLGEIEDILGKAADLSAGRPAVRADALATRAKVRHLRRNRDGSRHDVEETLRLSPDHSEALMLRAGEQQEPSDEIALLRRAASGSTNERAWLILAIRLLEAGSPGERSEAATILADLSRRRDNPLFEEAALYGVRAFLELDEVESARALAEDPALPLHPSIRSVLRARIRMQEGDGQSVQQLVAAAIRELGGASSTAIRALAVLLGELERHGDAVSLWEQIAPAGVLTPDTTRLIDAARRAGRDDLVLRYCASLRQAGESTPRLLDLEASIAEAYDPEVAVDLLRTRLVSTPDDRMAHLRLSILGLRLKRPSLVCSDVQMLPTLAEATPATAFAIVEVLATQGKVMDAVRYAYAYLRCNLDDSDAHRVFLNAMSPERRGVAEFIPVTFDVVQAGTAVRYREDNQEGDAWIILEDDPDVVPGLNEVRSDSASAKRFVGRRVGDRVLLASGVQDRWATVQEVVSKYTYRYRDCMAGWQVRFPSDSTIQMIHVGEVGTQNVGGGPSPLVDMVEERAERFQRLYEQYERDPIPVAVLAGALSVDIVSTVHGIAMHSGIKCVTSAPHLQGLALTGLAAGKPLILDATAVGTILLLGIERELMALPVPLVVTYAVVDEIEQFLDRNASGLPSGSLGRTDGHLVMRTADAAEAESTRRLLEGRLSDLRARLTVRGAQPLAAFPPGLRDELIQLYGRTGAEALAVAADTDSTLWSDDLWVTAVTPKLGVRRAWTEITLRYYTQLGALHGDLYANVAAKLVGFGYREKFLSVKGFLGAGRLASWNPAVFPLQEFIRSVGESNVAPGVLIRLTGACLAGMYLEVVLPEIRSAVVTAILEALPRRDLYPDWLPSLREVVERAFGLNALGLREVLATMDAWQVGRGST